MHHALVIAGTTATILGVLCVGAPDWRPDARLSAARLRIRRLLRRSVTVYAETGTATAHAHLSGVGVVSMADDAPLDARVAFLMKQVGILQQSVGHLESEVAEGLERRWTDAIEGESRRLRDEMGTGLKRVRSDYLRVRLFGLGLLVIGGVLLMVADFVA
jgi:hypothetical protein